MTSLSKFIFFTFCIFLLGACKSEPFYKTVPVDFFIQHPNFSLEPATFDTLTELVLVKDAYLTGATFETVTEQVLVRESYRDIRIMDIQFVNMLADYEENLFCAVPCITYFSEDHVEQFEVRAVYTTRTLEKLFENGTGDQVPAEYATRQYLRQRTHASINPEPTTSLQPLRKIFKIPTNIDFETHWQQQLMEQDLVGCGDALTYQVVE